MEKVLCQSKSKANKIAIILAIIGGFLLLLCLTVCYAQWAERPLDNDPYDVDFTNYGPIRTKTGFFNGFIWDMFIDLQFNRYLLWGIAFWGGAALLIYAGIIFLMMNRCSMTLFPTRVTGQTSFGKQVDLPVSQISAIGLGSFDRITVATSAGKINFWLVENRSEICETLNGLLSTIQTEKRTVPTDDPADKLLKYKDLLDKGVITQEEFEAKKKELLGL